MGHEAGVVAFSWCGFLSSAASFERQTQAIEFINAAKSGRDSRYALQVNPVPYYHIPLSLGSQAPRPASMKPQDLAKPLLYAYTAGRKLPEFSTHWQHSPDSKSFTNLLVGYSKATGENVGGTQVVQKSESLAVELILRFTNPGDYVLVPFAGTGTEVAACIKTGRNVVAFEKDVDRFVACQQRARAVINDLVSVNGPGIHWRFPTVRAALVTLHLLVLQPEEFKNETHPKSVFRWKNVSVKKEYVEQQVKRSKGDDSAVEAQDEGVVDNQDSDSSETGDDSDQGTQSTPLFSQSSVPSSVVSPRASNKTNPTTRNKRKGDPFREKTPPSTPQAKRARAKQPTSHNPNPDQTEAELALVQTVVDTLPSGDGDVGMANTDTGLHESNDDAGSVPPGE